MFGRFQKWRLLLVESRPSDIEGLRPLWRTAPKMSPGIAEKNAGLLAGAI
jgi:hypothetical protein